MSVLDVQVGADADDCYSYDGTEMTGNNALYHNYDNAISLVSAFRVANVTVGQGDEIDNAYISLYGDVATLLELVCRFHAEDADDGSVPESSDLDTLVKTTAYYDWTVTLSDSAFTDSPANSFDAVIQEVVNRPGWSSGNSITIIGVDQQSALRGASQEYSHDTTEAAKLHVESTPGGGASAQWGGGVGGALIGKPKTL